MIELSPRRTEGLRVNRLDGNFLYQVGAAIKPLTTMQAGVTTVGEFRARLWQADPWVRSMLAQNLVPLKACMAKGYGLLGAMDATVAELNKVEFGKLGEVAGVIQVYNIINQATEFQTTLTAELSVADIYAVQKKGGFDITELAENGLAIFPSALPTKVPDTIRDAKQAARCIAFELPTAAAFHLHLVLERVLRRFYDIKTVNKAHPEKRSLTAYIDAMKGHGVKDEKPLFSSLADIAKFHRNPVLHPDDALENTEEAIALLGTIRSPLTYMLKKLPEPQLELTMQEANGSEEKAAA